MVRPDLLALSPDDLAALANRGLIKRAQKEIAAAEFTAQWEESEDGTIKAVWSDGVTTTLPGGATVREARCTCGALELCRHVLRTILAWQAKQSTEGTEEEPKQQPLWDPGSMSDALLESQAAKPIRDRANLLWSQGILAELLRSAKPSARFHCPGHTVRFPVPNDLRYAQCSCADSTPCVHAVLAVRAFRLLAAESTSGIVSEGPLDLPVSEEPLAAAEMCVSDLLSDGFASLGTAWRDRVRRVAADCTAASLVWPAQILEELATGYEQYAARDAAFTPEQTAERAGELLLRVDAIRSGCAPVPQAFIRGMKSDRDSDLGSARFIGLGASISESRQSTTLTVFLQDCDNGHVVTLVREFSEDPEATPPPRPFHQLGRATAVKDASLALLAGGQLVTQGGRRTASGRLIIGRARAAVNPQSFAWEQLKAPVLVEDFAELTARLRLLPPASFRPRRAASDFHVCPVEMIVDATFDPRMNSVTAVLQDRSGTHAMLHHPWTERGQTGADALLVALNSGAKPLYVAGHVRASGRFLVVHPTAVVFSSEGGSRRAVMPWVDAASSTIAVPSHAAAGGQMRHHFRYRAAAALISELCLNGLRRVSERQWPGWSQAIAETDECGYHRMADTMRETQVSGSNPNAVLKMLKLLTLARDVAT